MLPVGKSMLEKRIYTRQELIEIYKTQRLDAIKNKVKKIDNYNQAIIMQDELKIDINEIIDIKSDIFNNI